MLFASEALANMRCSTNSFGVTTCRGSDGMVIKSRTNSLGTTTYTDNRGNTIKARRIPLEQQLILEMMA